ncbi:hypothetical protein PIB30_088913 [Stylosanthes scabra]|uniref:Uncharacterized protein n=1 Tax=Stylosanthes scabra TaxID=79078 RepID=A0ABU6YRH4_9FABA|nr:hypothetical protein [Stylosanthes scabra]
MRGCLLPGFLPRICVGLLRLCVDDGGLVMSESRICVVLCELADPPRLCRNPATGEEPDIQAMWQITHQKSNGEWVNEKAKEIDVDISLMVNESYESENPITPNKAFTSVRGEKGATSYGLKASKSKIKIQAQLDEAMQDREELTKEIDVLKEKLEHQRTDQEKKIAQMQSQLEAQQTLMNSLIARFDDGNATTIQGTCI